MLKPNDNIACIFPDFGEYDFAAGEEFARFDIGIHGCRQAKLLAVIFAGSLDASS